MDITIDTGDNKVFLHLEKFDHKKSFAVMIHNSSGLTVKTTVDELIKAIEVVTRPSIEPKKKE